MHELRPETRYVETPLGYLACQVFGEGERDLLFVTGGLSNLDAMWDEPSAVRFFDRLAAMGRVIVYDMRGSGVSDPVPVAAGWLPIESAVDDLRVVLDAAGSERAVVYGDTEGGLSAMMLAAVDPARVSALVLVNSHPRLLAAPDYPIGVSEDEADDLSLRYVRQHGTTGSLLELTAPGVADDKRFRDWWIRYSRLSVPMGLVQRTFDWFRTLDVRAALPLIQAPTLVVARRDARFHRLAYGEYLATHIAGATLRVVEGADTLPFHAGDFGPTLDAVEQFLAGETREPTGRRVLATVLFTDIVGSTERAAALGDERWLDLLADHDRIVAAQIERFQGTLVKTTGDGAVATFDGPARAVTAAMAIVDRLAAIGVTVRAGVHTGEVEYRHGEIGGIAVHIASRVMAHAEAGGVVVSGTVKDLVVGSGIAFAACGSATLKGVPGEWSLWAPVHEGASPRSPQ